jgi:hypothetical protein
VRWLRHRPPHRQSGSFKREIQKVVNQTARVATILAMTLLSNSSYITRSKAAESLLLPA